MRVCLPITKEKNSAARGGKTRYVPWLNSDPECLRMLKDEIEILGKGVLDFGTSVAYATNGQALVATKNDEH